jgi:uncharacterized membrane protein YkoI
MVLRRSCVMSILLLAAVTLSAAEPRPAAARDHDDVRRAVERGEIRPLAEILDAVQGKLPGEVAGVEIEQKSGRWLYEFRVVDDKGRLFEVYVDARSGKIERVEEK